MKSNPGGQIDNKEIVGRDEIVEYIRETLQQQSILLNAERRIGKTTILGMIHKEPPDGWVTVLMDLEQYHTALEFATAVYREVVQFLSLRNKAARRTRDFLESIGGTEIHGVLKLPVSSREAAWKDVLNNAIKDAVEERSDQEEKLLFLWDEVPFMLHNIAIHDGESVAMEVLDVLRSLRQTYGAKGLRMVLTGSIGLHHVIRALKTEGYTNSPVNDVLAIEITPLAFESGCELASKLLEGESIHTDNQEETSSAIAEHSDCFPFYIHHIVKALKLSGLDGSRKSVEDIVSGQLSDANDPWELNHYYERIPGYYGKSDKELVVGTLNSIACQDEPMAFKSLFAELKNMGLLEDREKLLDLLKLLEKDHYFTKSANGCYQFKFPLLQRWWKLSQEL